MAASPGITAWPTCSAFPTPDASQHPTGAKMDRTLVLVRHGQSDWNLKNLFTGWKNPELTPVGVEEAKKAGHEIKKLGISFDKAFTSGLKRAQDTCDLVLQELGQSSLPV